MAIFLVGVYSAVSDAPIPPFTILLITLAIYLLVSNLLYCLVSWSTRYVILSFTAGEVRFYEEHSSSYLGKRITLDRR